jgi:hypothetical protein
LSDFSKVQVRVGIVVRAYYEPLRNEPSDGQEVSETQEDKEKDDKEIGCSIERRVSNGK